MKTKQKKEILFTEEEIKKLLELGFEPNHEGGKARKPKNIDSFWKNYSDPKDDEEDWQMCISCTKKPGVFKVHFWAWRYPPAVNIVKGGINGLMDYLVSGKYVDEASFHKEKVVDQLGLEFKEKLTPKQIKEFKKEFNSYVEFGLSLINTNPQQLNKLIKTSKGVKIEDLLFSYANDIATESCDFLNFQVDKDLIEESKKEVCSAWVKDYLSKMNNKIVS